MCSSEKSGGRGVEGVGSETATLQLVYPNLPLLSLPLLSPSVSDSACEHALALIIEFLFLSLLNPCRAHTNASVLHCNCFAFYICLCVCVCGISIHSALYTRVAAAADSTGDRGRFYSWVLLVSHKMAAVTAHKTTTITGPHTHTQQAHIDTHTQAYTQTDTPTLSSATWS